MKISFKAWKRIPLLTLALLALYLILLAISFSIGYDSDRGVLVGWLGIIILLTEVTRRWRKEWQFIALIAGAFLGSILVSGLHELLIGTPNIIEGWWPNVFHGFVTYICLHFTPMAIIYGLLATITLLIIRLVTLRRKKEPE
ncbi:MAG: hypothetical protein PHG35_05500 [Dehalococcoidales bacterium]|nr:hypothetical protein [Dehalococcoidales bacterium]